VSFDDRKELPPQIGPFLLLDLLGRGGAADVYLAATKTTFGAIKLAVLKCVRGCDEHDMANMFVDEARLACRLTHPNVVTCYEAGVIDDESFLAMEYLEGQPLSSVIKLLKYRGERMPPAIAARVMADVLRGLHYAHTLRGFGGEPLKIIHRDVSPANVFVTYGGVTKVLDFGIAKWAFASNRTSTGLIKGKLAYMPPEQALAVGVDERTDVYAAGVTLWEMLAGRSLHGRAPAATIFLRVLNQAVPRLSEVGVEVLPALDEVVARAVARDQEGRYVDAHHFRQSLERAVEACGGTASEAEVGAYVSGLFADEKLRRARTLADQLRSLRDAEPEGARQAGPAIRSTPVASEAPTVHAVVPTAPSPQRPRRRRALVGAAMLMMMSVVGVMLAAHPSLKGAHAAAAPPVADASIADGGAATGPDPAAIVR